MSDLISRDAAIAAIETARQAFALPDDVPGSRLVNAGFAAARGAVEKVPSGWVSVNEALLQDGEVVVAIITTHHFTSMNLCKFKDGKFSIIAVPGSREDVKYWAPLPWPLPKLDY